MSTKTVPEGLMDVWQWCIDAYLRHGIKLSFPAHTDPTKTYQWRYLTTIHRRFREWNFDEPTARHFLDVAVDQAKQAKVLRKGLAALVQGNLLECALKALDAASTEDKLRTDALASTHHWLLQQCGERNKVTVLLQRQPANKIHLVRIEDVWCNLTVWFQANQISRLYMALSKACGAALARMAKEAPEERALLPSSVKLLSLRERYLADKQNRHHSRAILGQDWRPSCRHSLSGMVR